MSQCTIRCRRNGPFIVEGPFRLLDHNDQPFTLPTDKPAVALCRCGLSNKKPFCDGSHRSGGFVAEETASSA